MLGKLSVALLIMSSPAWADDPAPTNGDETAEAEAPVAYKIKRVCRSVEVVGSAIPRTTCKEKRIPIQPKPEATDAEARTAPADPRA